MVKRPRRLIDVFHSTGLGSPCIATTMSLPQPQATSVQTHIVEIVDDWASFCELSGTLRLLDSQPDAVQSTISHQASYRSYLV